MEQALEFEGQEITQFFASIPAIKVEADQSYARGTYLNLNVQVRVRSARFEETKTGDLQKVHVMAVESLDVTSVVTPEQIRAQIEAAEQAAQQAADKEPEDEPEPVAAEAEGADQEGWEDGYPQGQVEPVAANAGF